MKHYLIHLYKNPHLDRKFIMNTIKHLKYTNIHPHLTNNDHCHRPNHCHRVLLDLSRAFAKFSCDDGWKLVTAARAGARNTTESFGALQHPRDARAELPSFHPSYDQPTTVSDEFKNVRNLWFWNYWRTLSYFDIMTFFDLSDISFGDVNDFSCLSSALFEAGEKVYK